MARGKGGTRSNSGRGGSLNTSNRQLLASPTTSHIHAATVSRSTPGRGAQQLHNHLGAPHVVSTSVAPYVPDAPRAPSTTATSGVPAAPRVHVPLVEDVPEDINPANDQPKKTRGLTKGVKGPKKAGQLKVLVTVLKHTLLPPSATSKIGPIFRRHFDKGDKLRTKWSHWGEELGDLWIDYLRYFRFASPEEEARGKIVWEYLCARNYPKYLHGWKRQALKAYGSIPAAKNHKPEWTSLKIWQDLCNYWMSEAFRQSSALRKRNRSSLKNIPHTSGRIPYEKVDLKLAESLGRPPTQIERFTETHIRKKKSQDNNGNDWVSEDAKKLQEVYANQLREENGLDPTTEVNAVLHPGCDAVSDPGCKIWEVAAGGARKGRLFGRPGEKWSKRPITASSIDYAAILASQNASEDIKKLKEDLELKTIQLAQQSSKFSQQSKELSETKAYMKSIAPILAILAERGGLLVPSPPLFSDNSAATPSSDGASNIPTNASPCNDDDGNGETNDIIFD